MIPRLKTTSYRQPRLTVEFNQAIKNALAMPHSPHASDFQGKSPRPKTGRKPQSKA